MESQFWHQRWALNQIGFHQAEIQPLLRQHWPQLKPAPGQGVLVPLCGKSRDLWWLQEQGQRVVGAELSPVAVQAFYAEAGVAAIATDHGDLQRWHAQEITLYCGDFFALQPADVADCQLLYDRAALIALPPPMRRAYATHLHALFPKGARLLLITMDYPASEMAGPPFSVGESEVRELFSSVKVLSSDDRLAANPQLAQRGVTRVFETAYLIEL